MEGLKPDRATAHTLLTLLLWLGFWLLGAALVVGLAFVPIAQLEYQGDVGVGGFVAGLLSVAIAWALRPRGWFRARDAAPPPLDAAAHPELYALARELAARAGVAPPDTIHLAASAAASTRIERRWLGLRRQRVLVVGLPLFASLSRAELSAVLAHEFGHHAGGDLRLAPWVHRTRKAIAEAIFDLDDSIFFLDLPFRAYGALFLRVSGSVSREQERVADALAASLNGARAIAGALVKLDRLAPAWSAYLALEASPLIGLGARLPLLEGFRRFGSQAGRRPEVERRIEELARTSRSPGDTHPTTDERLAAVGVAPAEVAALLADRGPDCLGLLGGAAAAEEVFYRTLVLRDTAAVSWEQIGERFIAPSLTGTFAGAALDPASTPLEQLPALLDDPEALWDGLRGGHGINILSPAAKRQRVARLLADWLAASLLHHGYALVHAPGAPPLLRRGAIELDPAAIVDSLITHTLTPQAYNTHCATWTAPPTALTPPSTALTPPQPP